MSLLQRSSTSFLEQEEQVTGTPDIWQTVGFPALACFAGVFMKRQWPLQKTMTFAEISKPWQLSSKLSSKSVPFAFPNRLEQLERKEGT